MNRLKSTAEGDELTAYVKLQELYQDTPLPDDEILANLGLYLSRAAMSRILFMHSLYLKVLDTHGVVLDLGTRWGQNAALFTSFRSIYEPYNASRKIIAFDTFEGFPSVGDQDGDYAHNGAYSVSEGYDSYLCQVLSAHQHLSHRGHVDKFEIVKGDATVTLHKYLAEHPETIIALAYFDLDLYEPTKVCIEQLLPYLTKGSILGFDELCLDAFPGETVAFRESSLSHHPIHRSPLSSHSSYIVVDEL